MKVLKENVRKYLKSQSDVQFAYLFGSALHGFFNEESDIDIAMYLEKTPKDFFTRRLELIDALSKICKRSVDIIVLNSARSLLLKFTILMEGVCVYERDSLKRKQFEFEAMSRYYDYQPLARRYDLAYVAKHI